MGLGPHLKFLERMVNVFVYVVIFYSAKLEKVLAGPIYIVASNSTNAAAKAALEATDKLKGVEQYDSLVIRQESKT